MNKNNIPQSSLVCESPKEWHEWLESHYDTETEVWLEIKKAKSLKQGIRLDEAVEEAICFGWIDGKMHSLDQERYILRFTPRKPGSIWSLVNRKRAEALIAEKRMTEAGLEKIEEAKASGRWQNAYSSKVKPEIPDDLLVALQADPIACDNFERWTNSQKRIAVWWVEESRQAKTRENRIAKIVSSAQSNQKLS